MVTDIEILEYFIDNNRNAIISSRINRKNLSKNKLDYKKYLEERYEDFRDDYCEVIYRIANGIEKIPVCRNCGKKLKYHGFKDNSYGKWCSCKCQLSDKEFIKWREENMSNEVKERKVKKAKETKFLKYGNENYNNREKTVKTNLERFGSTTPLTGEKRKEWENELLNIYGKKTITNPQKTKETKFLRYGDEGYCNHEKARETMLERYGAKTTMESSVLTEKVRKTLKNKYGNEYYVNHEKAVNTMKERYGVENPWQLKKVRDKISYDKILLSKKKNGTFNSSTTEKKMFDILSEIYPQYTILTQYEDERYINEETNNKYQCDFYIKEIDFFIELNGHYTHGPHPFNENDEEDVKLLEFYKTKNKPSYKILIDVWTKRDVSKRKVAQKNGLKYMVVYGVKFNKEDIIKEIQNVLNNE